MKKRLIATLITLSAVLCTAFRLSEDFSEFYTMRIAPVFRIPLSFISSIFPFSIAESLVIILFGFILALLFSGIHLVLSRLFKRVTNSFFRVYARIVCSILIFIFVTYSLTFASAYSRRPISKTLGLESVEMSSENISSALDTIAGELKELSDKIEFREGSATRLPMSFDEMTRELVVCAKKASKKYPVFQRSPYRAKALAFSEPLAYTGISGIYSFFTGESNINTSFSHYSLPFTVAHEYSHQLGIGSEMEAEFSALLICLESDDPYVRYSAYSQAAITLSNLLFELDEHEFYNCFEKLPRALVTDIYLSAQAYRKYSETSADEIAHTINDTYLSLSGDGGVISYSLSSQLYVAYFLNK